MSCTDCTNCTKSTTKIPNCFEGNITIGTAGIGDTYFLTFTRGNGAKAEIEVTGGLAGELIYSDLDFIIGWFYPGWFQIDITDVDRAPYEITLSDATLASCITFEVISAASVNDDDIELSF